MGLDFLDLGRKKKLTGNLQQGSLNFPVLENLENIHDIHFEILLSPSVRIPSWLFFGGDGGVFILPIDTFPLKHKKLDSFEWICHVLSGRLVFRVSSHVPPFCFGGKISMLNLTL